MNRVGLSAVLVSVSLWSASADARATGSWFKDVGQEIDLGGMFSTQQVLPESFDPIPKASNSCRLQVLRRLGWNVNATGAVNEFTSTRGNPCTYTSLSQAQSAGTMSAVIPADGAGGEAGRKFLNELLLSDTSVCAYKLRVATSVRAAATSLAKNPNFGFYSYDVGAVFHGSNIPWWGSCLNGSRQPNCYIPKNRPSTALSRFVTHRTAADCAVGLQVAEYETLHQLYGSEAFDQTFDPSEIVIGQWRSMHNSASATWGRDTDGGTENDTTASKASTMGPRWLEGMSGYIENVYGESYLDNQVDRGENFLTVSVSTEAFNQLREHGSFKVLNEWNLRLHELAGTMGPRAKELIMSDQSLDRLEMNPRLRERIEEARHILRQPLYAGYKVYVHPLGIRSLGSHVHRLLQRNPRTPYRVDLYQSRVNRGLYWRYVQYLASQCAS